MMRSPPLQIAATTATFVPCHSSFRFPSPLWALYRGPSVRRSSRNIFRMSPWPLDVAAVYRATTWCSGVPGDT
jgi:hypothetical protein